MPFLETVKEILSGGIVKGILDKIPDAGQKAQAALEVEKEVNRAAEAIAQAQQKELETYLADAQNARAMQIAALTQEDKFSKRFVYYLTAFLVVCGFGYIYMVTYYPVPLQNKEIVNTVMGLIIGTVFGSVLSFFYGTTKSSNEKSTLIAQLAKEKTKTDGTTSK